MVVFISAAKIQPLFNIHQTSQINNSENSNNKAVQIINSWFNPLLVLRFDQQVYAGVKEVRYC